MDLWGKSLDVWENPLRPANLIDGTYKGGQRPLDLYWRLAKGINGAKMPAHAGLLTDDQIWDVVNFVLAVRDDPGLLPESLPTAGPARDGRGRLAPSRTDPNETEPRDNGAGPAIDDGGLAPSQGANRAILEPAVRTRSGSSASAASPTPRSTRSGGSPPGPTRSSATSTRRPRSARRSTPCS